jgi:preprotein translocase subunit SecE
LRASEGGLRFGKPREGCPPSREARRWIEQVEAAAGIGHDMADTNTTAFDNVKNVAGGRIERARLFLSEVRNELKRVTWPSQREVYATTIVVILTSAFFGLYLFLLDQILLNTFQWILRKFGAA